MKKTLACSLCGLILLALGWLPHRCAAQEAGETHEQSFALRIVGPDGKHVPEASVEVRTSPNPTAEQIDKGKFIRKSSVGALATTDAQGRLVVRFPQRPKRFAIKILTPSYGPYWAEWSSEDNSQPLPSDFTAELEAGWSVGGIVVDSAGNPIQGVSVHPRIEYKKPPGDLSQLGVGTRLKTDTAGKWRFDSVPASQSEVSVEISHSGFMPDRRSLTRSEFGIEPGQKPAVAVTLHRGLTVIGKVTDESGQPIAGAQVRTKFLNDIREATTGEDGVYRLAACEPRRARIVVSARGRATDMKELTLEPEMGPLDFQMQPGGTVRIRVLDEHDKPVPKARIFFQGWRGRFHYFEFDHVSQYADAQGVWVWNEAPLDVFEADICRPDGMQLAKQAIVARDEEYVFRPPPALVISGKVIDAQTREPVKKFQVVPGIRSSETHMNWARGEQFTATEGKYRIRHRHDYFAHLVRIEAEGYQPAVSRDIKSDEGNVTIDFELTKGSDVAATVLMPDGRPAAGARVALGIAGSQINIHNGKIDNGSSYCARQDADENGKFRFPPQDGPFQLVITHPTGYAHIDATPERMPATIELEAWARVEGIFRVGRQAVAGARITINSVGLHSYGQGLPSIFSHHDVTTAADGRFVFERVVAGPGRISRGLHLTVTDGATEVTSSCSIPANFPTGQTTHLDLGGSGRPVVGTLEPPRGHEGKVDWRFAMIRAGTYLPTLTKPGDPPIPAEIEADLVKKAAWMQEWERTPAGQGWTTWKLAQEATDQLRQSSPHFTATVDRDGSFRIDDMPPGDYLLWVSFNRGGPGQIRDYRFSVPAMHSDRSDDELDLGTLTLQ